MKANLTNGFATKPDFRCAEQDGRVGARNDIPKARFGSAEHLCSSSAKPRKRFHLDRSDINKSQWSFLGHSGPAQAGEVSGFEQGADLWHAEISDRLQAGKAGVSPVAVQRPRLGEFGHGAIYLTVEGV